ncbi:hypothetical protein CK203_059218 [Vitis vinifera]|nr:hypothetical protein CK203_059218 [Vitis vinifera]
MEETKTMNTPMSSSIKLDKDEKGKSIDSTMYRGMIGHRASVQLSRLNPRLIKRREELRFVWTRRVSVIFLILLRLDSKYMSPRCGPLCQDFSLERPFKGSVDFQTPREWATLGTQPDDCQQSAAPYVVLYLSTTKQTPR